VFRVAVVLLDRPDAPAVQEDFEKLESLKLKFKDRFEWATGGRASVVFMQGIASLQVPAGQPLDWMEIASRFHETHPDAYEFLFLFDTFTETGPSLFWSVRNDTLGIGQELHDDSELYGSNHVLLGMTHLKSIRLFDLSTPETTEMHLNAMLHEMVHRWCAYVDYRDENGELSQDLRNPMDGFIHWSKFMLGGDIRSVMGGMSWVPAGDGAWLAVPGDPKKGLAPIDLYLMGLLSPEEVPDMTLIVSDTPQEEVNVGVLVTGYARTVSIGQVIAAEGKVTCLPDACIPDCGGKTCGDDGCGGSCGGCPVGMLCAGGQCGEPCGDIGTQGCCQGAVLRKCSNGILWIEDCGLSKNGPYCVKDQTTGIHGCSPEQTPADSEACPGR